MKAQSALYITLAIFIIISLVLVGFFIYPTFLDIKNNSEETSSSKQQAALLYLQNKEVEQFNSELELYKEDLKRVDGLFIDPSNPVDFIKFLERNASALGISTDINLAKSDKTASDALNSYFKIDAEGGFSAIVKFVQQVESGPYLTKINNLSINNFAQRNQKGEKTSNLISATLSIQVANKK